MTCYQTCCTSCNPCCCIKSNWASGIVAILDIIIGCATLYFSFHAFEHWKDEEFKHFIDYHELFAIACWGLCSIPLFAVVGVLSGILQLLSAKKSPHAFKFGAFLVVEVLGFGLPLYFFKDYDAKITLLTEFSMHFVSFNLLKINFITITLFIYQIISFWVVERHDVIATMSKPPVPTPRVQFPDFENQLSRKERKDLEMARAAKAIHMRLRPDLYVVQNNNTPLVMFPQRCVQHSVLQIEPVNRNDDIRPSTSTSCSVSATALRKRSKENPALSKGKHLTDFERNKRRVLNSGSYYKDPHFPPTAKSLGSYEKAVQWKRPFDINPDAKFVTDGYCRFDVKQGDLGNCWFLAALGGLTLTSSLLEYVVPSDNEWKNDDYCGMCHFRFFNDKHGLWEEVVIDDYLPTRDGRLIFMSSGDESEFWSALIEKAYAKFNGSYLELDGNNGIGRAMTNLTGGTVDRHYLPQFRNRWEKLFEIMKLAKENGKMLGCCTSMDFEEKGIFGGHAYSVTHVEKIVLKTGILMSCIRIRNPWGNQFEWSGEFSDGHPIWELVDKQVKQQLELKFHEDGEFWFPVKSLVEHFDIVEICHVEPVDF